MYVALTRARRSLHVSASNWYGENVRAKGPSEFFAELADWGTTTGEADVTIEASGPPSGDDDGPAEQNPMLGYRESLVRDWPGPARPDDADATFPDGWRRTAVAAIEAGAVQTALVDALDADDRAAFERVAADRRQLAAHLREREAVEGGPSVERAPQAVGASDLITYVHVPEALLLVARAPAAPLQRPRGPHRHRDPRLDRTPRPRPGPAARDRGPPRPHRRGTRGRPGPRRPPARVVPREPVLVDVARCTPSAPSCCASASSRSADASTRSSASPTAPGRSSTGRRAASPPPTTPPWACSSTCTGSPPSRSGARLPRT